MTEAHQTSTLEGCLREVWRRGQRKHLGVGLLVAGRWAIALFLLAVAVDWFSDLPAWTRGLAVVALVTVSLQRGWRHGWRHLRRFDPVRTAVEIEKHQGGMDSLLVTAEQFGRSGAPPGTSRAMWALTHRRAEEKAASLKPAKIVTFGALRRPLLAACAVAAVLAAVAAFDGPLLTAGAARLFTPWLAVAYPTKTQIDLAEGDLVVKEGDRASIEARLSGIVPTQAKLFLQTGTGRPREMVLEVVDGRCEYVLASASRDFTYRIKAGDARSDWHRVRVIPAPRIEHVKVHLTYPDYIGRPPESVESLTLTLPENTKVRWELTLDCPVGEAVLHRDGMSPVPVAVDDDGRRLVLDEVVTASRGYSFGWVERDHGFAFTSPRSYLQVAADQPPRVELTSPDENLHALLGRPLQPAVRAQDDHGLAPATITYRVNRRPEKTVSLPTPVRSGDGEQSLEWDYREALPDLEVGDTVSFLVEVSDLYPGEGGPHRARTEARRITFLTREEYLAEIRKKIDRLLSRVRTLYRQERAAHELTRGLDVTNASFVQSSQLEAVRQEMIREQLQATARDVQAVRDDLAANAVADAVEIETLDRVRAELESIAVEQVGRAAALLREEAAAPSAGDAHPGPAFQAVNAAARRLGGLVLQHGIDAAREVFARESRMLAEEQLQLSARGTEGIGPEAAAAYQEEVATWTHELLASLEAGIRYDRRPLAVLALTRRIKDLRAAGVEDAMREAAAKTRAGNTLEAASLQAATIPPLLAAEFSVRTGAEYATIMDVLKRLDALVGAQQRLRSECDAAKDFGQSGPALSATQAGLQESLALTLVPAIPAQRPRLFDDVLPTTPPIGVLRLAAAQAMEASLAAIRAGDRDAAVRHQRVAEESLTAFRNIVALWAIELGTRTQGLSTLVTDATDRLVTLEKYEARQIGLLEQTEEVALDGKDPTALAEPQRFLAEELTHFRASIATAGDARRSKDASPLLGRLDRAVAAMTEAGKALETKRAEDALVHQEGAADVLAAARELTDAQRIRVGLLQELFSFQGSVSFARDSMGDLVAEQRDLAMEVESADEKECEQLLPVLRNFRQCLDDIAPVLALVAGRLDAGTPLLFAGSDVDDVIAAVEDGDTEDAAEILKDATESLARVQALVAAVQTQTGYIAEIVEFLHGSEADAAEMAFRQEQIREKVDGLPSAVPDGLVAEQEGLHSTSSSYGLQLGEVTGMPAFAATGGLMGDVVPLLRAGKPQDAVAQMKLAEASLTENAEKLFVVMTMLHGLPSIEVTSAASPELKRLLDVLALASEQRQISRRTQSVEAADLGSLAESERAIEVRATAVAQGLEPHPLLTAAIGRLANAAASLKNEVKPEAIGHQHAADELLRHFVIEQALILNTATPPSHGSDAPVLTEDETDDLAESVAGFVSDFVSGEAPKDKRTEWEMLGARNRAALNQNFARELPLEYRATLKNYYERVAK